MFKKNKDTEVDYTKLNEGIRIGVDILKIFLILIIVSLVFISSKLIIDWKILPFIKTILKVLSPLFIGIVLAWLFDPAVTKLQKKGVSRVLGAIFVYVLLIFFVYLLSILMIPSVASQLEDLGASVPNFISYLQEQIDNFFSNFKGTDMTNIKEGLYTSITDLSNSLTVDLPGKIVSIGTIILAGGINLLLGLFVGLYMLFDFDSVKKHINSLIPKKYQKDTFKLFGQLNRNLKSYVQGTLLIMAILFVIQSASFALAGLKAPLVFGLFCALTDIIPYIDSAKLLSDIIPADAEIRDDVKENFTGMVIEIRLVAL